MTPTYLIPCVHWLTNRKKGALWLTAGEAMPIAEMVKSRGKVDGKPELANRFSKALECARNVGDGGALQQNPTEVGGSQEGELTKQSLYSMWCWLPESWAYPSRDSLPPNRTPSAKLDNNRGHAVRDVICTLQRLSHQLTCLSDGQSRGFSGLPFFIVQMGAGIYEFEGSF